MLSWIPFGSSYAVQRGTAAGGPYSTVATLTGTTYTDTGLASGSAYYYRVSDGVTNTNEERVVLPLFKDDFESGNGTGWTQNGGNWTIGTDLTRYFHQNDKSGQYAAVASGAGPWANYSVQANVKVFGFGSSSGWAGLLARYTDAGNYYYVRLDSNNTLEVRKKANGVDSLLAGKAFTVTAGTTTPNVGPVYLVKLEANGSTLKCYLDGRLELTATDASHSSGRVGVSTNDADALFDEILVKQAPASSDFNTDGNPDLVWQNQTTGEIGVWFMNGTNLMSPSLFNPGQVPDTNWKVVGTADFNSDSRPDLVWQNQVTGQIGVWFMNGTNLISPSLFNPGQVPDTDWRIVGTADFNGDSKPDLVWQNQTTGQIGLWFMDGITLLSVSLLNPPQVTDTNWKIVATGDFDNDSQPDLVWQNQATGQMGVWFMIGASLSRLSLFNPPQVSDTSWRIVGMRDLNGDNQADLIWQNQVTGQIGVWSMRGVSVSSVSFFNPSQVTDTNWRIAQVWNLLTASVSPISPASSGLWNNLSFTAPRFLRSLLLYF
jgi:VCBS repeat protein